MNLLLSGGRICKEIVSLFHQMAACSVVIFHSSKAAAEFTYEGVFLIDCRKSLFIQFLVIGITISGWCGWLLISCLS